MAIEFVPEGEDLTDLTRDEVQDLVVAEWEMENNYEDMLNDVYGVVTICGYEYDSARALRDVDPIAYRCGYADYVSEYYVEVDLNDFPASPVGNTRKDGDPLAD